MFQIRRHLAALVTATSLALAVGLAGTPASADQSVSGLAPLSPQPAPDSIEPGLAVEYLSILANHVDEIEIAGKGRPGGVLETLDWNMGDGEVLTSGEENGVAARITGMIRFPKAGTYVMTAQSNDGVRLTIADKVVIDDPDVHPDRFSENVSIAITEPGWYDFYMLYFEKRNTATLELYWQPPGSDGFSFVPAEAFAHPK